MAPIIKNVLAKLQIVGTIKRDVIYGPIHLQGMGFKHLYSQIGAMHISLLIQFHDTDTDLGRMLQNTLECMTMELGTQCSPFTLNYKKFEQCVTASWIKHLWRFCFENNIILKCTKKYFPHRRANEKNMMNSFIANGYHGAQLSAINRCRLYLQVHSLSNITTGDGIRIEKSSYNGQTYSVRTCVFFCPL